MSTEIIVALIVLVGGTLTVLGNYLVGRRQAESEDRKTSGSISTSDAASLWEESNNLRREYKERAEQLEKQLEEVNNKLQAVMEELGKLRINSATMIEKIAELKAIIADLREENRRLLAAKEEAETA